MLNANSAVVMRAMLSATLQLQYSNKNALLWNMHPPIDVNSAAHMSHTQLEILLIAGVPPRLSGIWFGV